MAQQRRGAPGGGGFLGAIKNGVWLVIVAGLIVGFGKASGVSSISGAIEYAKDWSAKADECYGDEKDIWKCEGKGGSGPTVPSPSTPKGKGSTTVTPKEYDALMKKLNSIPVKGPATIEYNRQDWKHWSDPDRNGCTAREDTLLTQGLNVVTDPKLKCKSLSGEWTSPYEAKLIKDPSSIDIDHVIPLAYAARHGGQGWTPAQKEVFANDSLQLLATSATENRKKSDRGPSEYMPPKTSYWCTYSKLWVETASRYKLWLEPADVAKLKEGLGTC